jgi:exonuclease III
MRNLRIVTWNANSVSTTKAELHMFLLVNTIDIAAISETKLSRNRRFSIPGYTTVQSDRNQFGGGVMLLINNKIRHDHYHLPHLTGPEATATYLYLQNHRHLLFVSAYLPPTATLTNADLDYVFTQHDLVILVGDLNSKHAAWGNTSENKNGKLG